MGASERIHPSRQEPAEDVGLAYDLWRTKCWRLFPLLTTYVVSLTFLMPVKPNLMTGEPNDGTIFHAYQRVQAVIYDFILA